MTLAPSDYVFPLSCGIDAGGGFNCFLPLQKPQYRSSKAQSVFPTVFLAFAPAPWQRCDYTGTTAALKSLIFNFRRLRAKIDRVDGLLRRDGREKFPRELRVHMRDVELMEERLLARDQSLNPAGW